MSLAESLEKKAAQTAAKQSVGARPIGQVLKEEKHRPVKILLQGAPKAGKTSFILSVFEWLEAKGYKPEQCKMFLLDCDDGTLPLIDKGVIKEDWHKALMYARCNTMDDVIELTNQALPELQAWSKEHGKATAWLCVDNMKFVWEWTREKFALDVYGKLEHELALEKRIEAQSRGKKMAPTFNQLTDYAVISPIHNHWAERIKLSGINFIWATPEKSFTKRGKDGKDDEEVVYAGGQTDNEFRVDHILRLHTIEEKVDDPKSEDNGKIVTVHLADLVSSRVATKYFRNARPPGGFNFRRFMEWMEKWGKMNDALKKQ